MAHAQKPDFVFRRNGRVHLNRPRAAEVCASAVVMLDTPCSVVVWRVLVTHFIRQFPLNFPTRATPCAITFQLESTTIKYVNKFYRESLSIKFCENTPGDSHWHMLTYDQTYATKLVVVFANFFANAAKMAVEFVQSYYASNFVEI